MRTPSTHRRDLSRSLTAAALTFGALATPAGAAVELAGKTIVAGAGAGYVNVHVVKSARFDVYGGAPFSIRRGGPLTAVVLRGLAPQAPMLGAWRGSTEACRDPGNVGYRACRDDEGIFIWTAHLPWSDGMPFLPRGDYRLYLVTDGSPAQVTITTADLSGEARLTPTTPVAAKVARLPRLDAPANDNAPVLGALGELRSNGVIMADMTLVTEGDEAHRYEWCAPPPGTAASQEPASFAPGCSIDYGLPWYGWDVAGPTPTHAGGKSVAMLQLAPPGNYAVGGNWTVGGTVRSVTGSAAWLDLYTPEPASAVPAKPAVPAQPKPAAKPKAKPAKRKAAQRCAKQRARRGAKRRKARCRRRA